MTTKRRTPLRGASKAKPATRAAALAAKIATNLAKTQASHLAQKQVATAAGKHHEARTEQQRLDEGHMRRVLEIAEQYRGRTAPNPIVGCVIVDAVGTVIAEGVHRGPGDKHAEIDALDILGGRAPGGTLYVNLEPCTHHGRTPPCAPVVVAAGLARIVIGSLDPVAGHGGGAAWLARQGLSVSRVLVDECDLANMPFRTVASRHLAAFTLKAAITLDGKIATVGGDSKWITGEAARAHGHHLRSTHDAILVGVGTVLADDPLLTSRIPNGRDPVRIVVDSSLRTPPTAKVLPQKRRGPRTIIATTATSSERAAAVLRKAGAEIWRFPAVRGQVNLAALAARLAEENLYSVLVEGGGQVHASLLDEGLATDLQLFIAPMIVGGPAPTWVGGAGLAKLSDAYGFRFVGEPQRFGNDLLIRAARVRL